MNEEVNLIMSQLSVQDWKIFLKARIEQEQGKDDQALRVFEALLEKYPNDQHVLSSRAFALERLGRADEAIASRIAAKYSELGHALVDENDKSEVWTSQLNAVLGEVDEFEARGTMAAAIIAW